MNKCLCCGRPAPFSVLLVNDNGRIYLPNQVSRMVETEYGQHIIEETWFCSACLKKIEDSLRSTISNLTASAS